MLINSATCRVLTPGVVAFQLNANRSSLTKSFRNPGSKFVFVVTLYGNIVMDFSVVKFSLIA